VAVLRMGILLLAVAQGLFQFADCPDYRIVAFALGCVLGFALSFIQNPEIFQGQAAIRVTKHNDVRTKEINQILACHISRDEVRPLLGDFGSRESPPKVLDSFSHLMRACGYKKCVVFIDSLDEAAPMKPQFLLKVLDSMLDYSLFSIPDLRMVVLFPCALDENDGRMKRRPDRSAVIKLEWSKADLFSFLEKRFPNLVKMCERLPKDQATKLKDDYLSRLETPRQALSFVKILLELATPELDYKPGPREFEIAVERASTQNPALLVHADPPKASSALYGLGVLLVVVAVLVVFIAMRM